LISFYKNSWILENRENNGFRILDPKTVL